jgi:hypothetical protein
MRHRTGPAKDFAYGYTCHFGTFARESLRAHPISNHCSKASRIIDSQTTLENANAILAFSPVVSV